MTSLEIINKYLNALLNTTVMKQDSNGKPYNSPTDPNVHYNWSLLSEYPIQGQIQTDRVFDASTLRSIEQLNNEIEDLHNALQSNSYSPQSNAGVNIGSSLEFNSTTGQNLVDPNFINHTYFQMREGLDGKLMERQANDKNNISVTNTPTFEVGDKITSRLLMPQGGRRVYIEDLDRNFWVISSILTKIVALLFEEDSPFIKPFLTIGDNLIGVWEHCLYLWNSLLALNGQTPIGTYVKHFPLNRLYYNFQNYNIYETESYNALNYIKEKYINNEVILLPYERIDNYKKEYCAGRRYSKVLYGNTGDSEFQIINLTSPIEIHAEDYLTKIYAIREKEYNIRYAYPFQSGDEKMERFQEVNNGQYYAILNTFVEEKNGNLELYLEDYAGTLIEKTPRLLYKWTIQKNGNNFTVISQEDLFNDRAAHYLETISRIQGFYLGDFITTKSSTQKKYITFTADTNII